MIEQGTQIPNNSSVEDMRDQLKSLLEENEERYEALLKGYGAALNPLDITNVRMSCLMSMLLDESARLRVEISTQTMLATMLDGVMESAAKQKAQNTLLQGVPGVDPNATPPSNAGAFIK